MNKLKNGKMFPFLIVTDLDSTLVANGNNDILENFNDFFRQHSETYGSKLVYATGRSLKLYRELESEVDLLPPDRLITSVGSEIYTKDRQMDTHWSNHLSENWNVDLVQQITSAYTQLRPQPASEQGAFKVSFLLKPEYANLLADLEQQLLENGVEAQIIYSSDKDLDILPKRSGKGKALSYVRESLGISPERTVACGDSGNDIALFSENTYGIIVGNARAELREWYRANQSPRLYFARSDYAEGILEGLRHFRWIE
jgi:sucrose-6-phosphatase